MSIPNSFVTLRLAACSSSMLASRNARKERTNKLGRLRNLHDPFVGSYEDGDFL